MLNEFFRPLNLTLDWEQFTLLPRHPAFRYEYQGGDAAITGNPRYYQCVLSLAGESPVRGPYPRDHAVTCFFSEFELRKLHPDDWKEFPNLFAAAFSRTAPLAQLSDSARLEASRDILERTRTGQDGPLLNAATFVIGDRETGEVLGASLITLIPNADLRDFTAPGWQEAAPPDAEKSGWGQPHLTWIFVSPQKQRRSVGTVLLRESVSALKRLGHTQLASTVLLGDHVSLLWHWRNGFELVSHPGSPRSLSGMSVSPP